MLFDILSDFEILRTTKERRESSIMEIVHVKSSQFLKCHRNATKQTNPLQVDNLITNKSVKPLQKV